MALTATLRRFTVELSDIDRSLYETLDLRVAQHPSESNERVVVRVLARAIAHEDGLEFGRGLSHSDDPALLRSDGPRLATCIEVGAPSADRLHRASKAADRLLVFTDKPVDNLRREWSARKVHNAEAIEVVLLPAPFVGELADRLDRNNSWWVTVHESTLRVSDGAEEVVGEMTRTSLHALVSG